MLFNFDHKLYKFWQLRTLILIMIAYCVFYFVRQNLVCVLMVIREEFNFSNSQVGAISSSFALIYGFGKGVSGYIGDKSGAKILMSCGLVFSGALNLIMGASSNLYVMCFVWGLNAIFQSMGAPACAKILAYWFKPNELGTAWSVWSSSQQMGASVIPSIAAYCLLNFSWRFAFYIPGVISILTGFLIFFTLKNSPEEAGLKGIEKKKSKKEEEDDYLHMTVLQLFIKKILNNKMIWIICASNFFLYVIRATFQNWTMVFVNDMQNMPLDFSVKLVTLFNFWGIFGSIFAGMLSDKIFGGYRTRVAFIFMIFLTVSIGALCAVKSPSKFFISVLFSLIGFLVAGPQTLIGVSAVDIASKRVAGTANGLSGVFGYAGSAFAGVGIGYIVDKTHSWSGVFYLLAISSLIGSFLLLFSWNKRSDIKKT